MGGSVPELGHVHTGGCRCIKLPPRIRAEGWTDDEWLAVMAKFPPDSPNVEAQEWVAQRRLENA